jgi:TfoX/Sxy family transcriptional regulator of competence genes
MFGNNAAFINGNMFMGLYGDDLFVRLSEDEGGELLDNKGASLFEPMKGRPMKGYFMIPRAWRNNQEKIQGWVNRSLAWTKKMPAKKPKK